MRAAILVCLIVFGLDGCAARHDTAPRPRALRVAVSPEPPYAVPQHGRLVGLEIDFARELAVSSRQRLEAEARPAGR